MAVVDGAPGFGEQVSNAGLQLPSAESCNLNVSEVRIGDFAILPRTFRVHAQHVDFVFCLGIKREQLSLFGSPSQTRNRPARRSPASAT